MRVSRTDLAALPVQREDRGHASFTGKLAGAWRNPNTGAVTIPWPGFRADFDGALALHDGRQVGVATSARGGSIVVGQFDPDLLVRLDQGGSVVVEIDGVRVDLSSLLGAAPARADHAPVTDADDYAPPLDYGRHAKPLRGRSDDDGSRDDEDDRAGAPLGDWIHGREDEDAFALAEPLGGDAQASAPTFAGIDRAVHFARLPSGAGVVIEKTIERDGLRARVGADRPTKAEALMLARRDGAGMRAALGVDDDA